MKRAGSPETLQQNGLYRTPEKRRAPWGKPLGHDPRHWDTDELCAYLRGQSFGREQLQGIRKKKEGEQLQCISEADYVQERLCSRDYLIDLYRFAKEYARSRLKRLSDFQESDYRKVAYRAFTLWIYERLGPSNRRAIPACTVNVIRLHYPAADRTYMGFIPVESDPYAADMVE